MSDVTDVLDEALPLPQVPLPRISMRPTGETTRGMASHAIGRPFISGDDDGNAYLCIPCQYMEVIFVFDGDELGTADLKQLREVIDGEITTREQMDASPPG